MSDSFTVYVLWIKEETGTWPAEFSLTATIVHILWTTFHKSQQILSLRENDLNHVILDFYITLKCYVDLQDWGEGG